jgi:hypothetical protein
VAAEIVAVLDERIQEPALRSGGAEGSVDLLGDLIISIGPAAHEVDMKLARGFVIAEVLDRR